ncbi:MAG: hypothetical protein KC503_11425 [Myxococcales bacterium]|nr:hypothetical protein [Myxococcales bacterium]
MHRSRTRWLVILLASCALLAGSLGSASVAEASGWKQRRRQRPRRRLSTRARRDRAFMCMAYKVAAETSQDPNTQVGAVIVRGGKVILSGANHLPKGVQVTEQRMQRPDKYSFIEHAERNAIFSGAKRGVAIGGSTIYVPWWPCNDCARAIVQSGVKEVVMHKQCIAQMSDRWIETINRSKAILGEGGVKVRQISGKLDAKPILFSGKIFQP